MSVGLSNLETDGASWLTIKAPPSDKSSPTAGPRTIEVRGSAERDQSVSSTGSNSIKTLLKDSTSFTKRLEAVEQQMLAMHMRAAAATEAAENIAQSTVAPFSEEISALKARMQITEQQLSSCAPASQIERLSSRLQQAEGSSLSTEHAVVLVRLEESVSLLSRQMHDTAVKVEDLERCRTDPERIERMSNSVDSIAAMMHEQQAQQATDANGVNSRLEALEQQLRLVQHEVVDIQTPQHSAVADLAGRISAMESSYQEMGSAILRHQEAIRPLIENEISGLVIRLDAQEKMIQQNAAQAICRAQIADEHEMEKKSYQEDLLRRITEFEQKLQAFAGGAQQTSTLSARVSVIEKQLAAAPSAGELKKLQAELQAVVEAADFKFQKAAENAVDEVRRQTSIARKGLAEGGQEKFLALSDVDRLSEVVAKAAASTIQQAERRSIEERRSAEDFYTEREKLRQELLAANEATFSVGSTSSLKDSLTGQDPASVTVSSVGDVNRMSMPSSGQGPTVGSEIAFFIGEMDAELRTELTGCLESVHQDIDALRQGLTLRIADLENRLEGMEENSGAKLKDMAEELSLYKQLQLDPKKAAEGPRVNLRPHSRKLAQADRVSSGPESLCSGPSSSAGRGVRHVTPTPQITRDASSSQGSISVTPGIDVAVKQMVPGLMQPGAVDEKNRSASPVRQPELPENLKANLRNLVSAVNNALGDAEAPVPERTSSVPFRSGVRSTSPPGARPSHSVPPAMPEGVGASSSTMNQGASPSASPTGSPSPSAMMPKASLTLPANRGRSPDATAGATPVAANRPAVGNPARSGSPPTLHQTPSVSGGGGRTSLIGGASSVAASIASTQAAMTGTSRGAPTGQMSQGGSLKISAIEATKLTRPGAPSTPMGRTLQQDRILRAAGPTPTPTRPSAGQPGMPTPSTGLSPRSTSASLVQQRRR